MTFQEFGKNIAVMRYDEPNNLVDLFETSVKKYPTGKYIGEKNTEGIYLWNTYQEAGERAANLRGGLASLRILEKGDRVGIIADNRSEWAICAYATYGLECSWVPMYEKELFHTWKYIIRDSAIKILFVSTYAIFNEVRTLIEEIPTLKKIFVIESHDEHSMVALEVIGKDNPVASKKPAYNDTAILIYTSGTTGDPKGVLLSHGNITSNVQAGLSVFPEMDNTCRALSILPWAHSYAHTAELTTFTMVGAAIGITTVDTMGDDLVKVRPTHLICVPRLFNKIYAGIHSKMEDKGGIAKKLFYMAKDAAEVKRRTGKTGLKFKLLDKMVFGKIRKKLGGRLRESLTASARTDTEVANFFFDIGLPVYDCYGLTEASPAITMNCPSAHRLGSVGKPIEKVKIVIDQSVVEEGSEDGEILAFGPNVMQGYHNKPEQTDAIMVEDENGIRGIRTGDRGKLDEAGYLFITGRIKSEFKLLNGKYVHPENIEQSIKLIPWVANVMLYGDGKPYPICLIVPDMEMATGYANELDLTVSPEELIQQKDVQNLISKEIRAHLKGTFGGYEIPKKFLFITEGFTLENGMLTQTLKLKRRNVLKKYGTQIESLYNEDIQ
jgi:long-chain acyl-CoA synthetase